MYNVTKKCMLIILPFSLLLMSCSHIPEITRPNDSASKSDWYAYYEDQFKAYGDEVKAPSEDAPPVQLQAYLEAKDSYEASVTRGWIIGGAVFALGLGVFIATIGQL